MCICLDLNILIILQLIRFFHIFVTFDIIFFLLHHLLVCLNFNHHAFQGGNVCWAWIIIFPNTQIFCIYLLMLYLCTWPAASASYKWMAVLFSNVRDSCQYMSPVREEMTFVFLASTKPKCTIVAQRILLPWPLSLLTFFLLSLSPSTHDTGHHSLSLLFNFSPPHHSYWSLSYSILYL